MRTTLTIIAILLLLAVPVLQAADNMKAFLPAEKGMVRYVLHLNEKDDESLYRVELIVGKTVLIDESNQYFFGGQIEEEQIVGWGYTQYKVRNLVSDGRHTHGGRSQRKESRTFYYYWGRSLSHPLQ